MGSVRVHAGGPDDRAPFANLRLEEAAQCLGRCLLERGGHSPEFVQSCIERPILHGGAQGVIELVDHGFGVPFGTHAPYQAITSNPFRPCSSNVGRSGNDGIRRIDVAPYARTFAALICAVVFVV